MDLKKWGATITVNLDRDMSEYDGQWVYFRDGEISFSDENGKDICLLTCQEDINCRIADGKAFYEMKWPLIINRWSDVSDNEFVITPEELLKLTPSKFPLTIVDFNDDEIVNATGKCEIELIFPDDTVINMQTEGEACL